MTFMRKFLDLLNMKNWENGTYIAPKDSISPKSNILKHDCTKDIDFQNIQCFWKSHPQVYRDSSEEATADEYMLYGKTLLLWLFEKASPLKTTFPVYFERECHISNPQKLQSELLHDSYIMPAPLALVLSTYKMQELKKIADNLGCAKGGKKAELINRIYENLNESMMNSIISDSNLFTLSEIGRAFLSSNYDYVELHRHWDYRISLYDYNQNRFPDNIRKRTFEDNVYTLISQRVYTNCLRRNYLLMDADYNILYKIALSEHLYDIAIKHYLRFLYLKSCCVYTAQYFSTASYHSNFIAEGQIIFTSHSASPIAELGKFYDNSYIENIYEDKSLPPSFLTKDDFIEMVKDMINETIFDYEKYNKLIIKRLQECSRL